MRRDWDDVPLTFRTALTIRYGTATNDDPTICQVCGGVFAAHDGLKKHWRGYSGDGCFLTLTSEMEDKLFMGSDVI